MSVIAHAIRGTNESNRRLCFGMRARSFTEELFIRAYNRAGLTVEPIADSYEFDTKDELHDAYARLIQMFRLPWCCQKHQAMFDPDEALGDLFDFRDTSTVDDLFDFGDEEEGDFFDDLEDDDIFADL